jgi:hypothetical protein
MIDNVFGPRRDPGFRLPIKCIPHDDLHVVPQDKNISECRQPSARDVIKIQTAYEPILHFSSPAGGTDLNRDRDLLFRGTPNDHRASFLIRLQALNPESIIPFSSKRPEHTREKVRVADDASLEGPAVGVDDLVPAEQRELLSVCDVLEKR